MVAMPVIERTKRLAPRLGLLFGLLLAWGCAPAQGGGSPPLARSGFSFDGGDELALPLRVVGERFVDALGRVVILRGVNLAGNSKVPPFVPIAQEESLDPLPGLGLNALRLLFTWEAYEPAPGQYDEGYLEAILRIAGWAGERGLYTLLDFHQDAFSRFTDFGCGDGFPRWTLPPSVTPARPDNDESCWDWPVKSFFAPGVHAAWKAFYQDDHGARTRYLAMIQRVAERAAEIPAIIGYDLLNEPRGDEAREILPLYEDAARAVRAKDPDSILFLCPEMMVSSGQQSKLPRPAFANFAYAPHFYDPGVVVLHAWLGDGPPDGLGHMLDKARDFGVPLIVNEYGAPSGTRRIQEYLGTLTDWMDANFVSGAQWNYTPGWTEEGKDGWNGEDLSIVDGHGQLRDTAYLAPHLLRAGGEPIHWILTHTENPADNTVSFTWNQRAPGLAAEIHLDSASYFGVAAVVESSDPGLRCALEGKRVLCQAEAAGVQNVRLRASARE